MRLAGCEFPNKSADSRRNSKSLGFIRLITSWFDQQKPIQIYSISKYYVFDTQFILLPSFIHFLLLGYGSGLNFLSLIYINNFIFPRILVHSVLVY
jgi:hypothetical protein